jgi:hypothetical protein
VRRFHDCDAVTVARATGAGAPGGASETVVGRFVHPGALEDVSANPRVDAFALVKDERTAVDFFADERALGCALPGESENESERPEPGTRANGHRRRSAPWARAPAPPAEPVAVEADEAPRAPKQRPLTSAAQKTISMSTIGCIALLSSAALIVYLAWPHVRRRSTSPVVSASCAPIPVITGTSAARPVPTPTLPATLPAAPPLTTASTTSFPYDERAAAVAFMVALAAAHPSDEAYREAARILRSTTKDAREARR